jgi:hypothetical protein
MGKNSPNLVTLSSKPNFSGRSVFTTFLTVKDFLSSRSYDRPEPDLLFASGDN